MSLRSVWKTIQRVWSTSSRRTSCRRWAVGTGLEERIVLAVTAYEQLFLELTNRARANPTAEATRYGINLNEGLPAGTIPSSAVQPLALNDSLQASIQGHLQDMINKDYFSHTGANGSTVRSRIEASGYTNWATIGENLVFRASTGTLDTEATVILEFQDLFVDKGIADRGHRVNILNPNYKETGSGVRTGEYQGMNAVFSGNDFGARAGNSFLTGVVINDRIAANNFYNVGEGLAGVSVVVKSGTTTVASTTSNAAGGYQIQVPAGTYQVTFSAAGWTTPITKTFSIGTQNVKVDANTRTDFTTQPPTPLVSFSASSYTVSEAGVNQIVTVRLSNATNTAVSVRYATSNGTAIAGSDYTATSGTLTFAPGETSKTFSIPINNDLSVEPNETIQLALSAPVGATLGTQKTSTVNITDNDIPTVSFTQTAKSASEATTSSSFTVTLSSAFTKAVTVRYALQTGGTATSGVDFTLPSGTLTFAPGEVSKTIAFTLANDTLDENDETFSIALSAPSNATLGPSSVATYTIVDNDASPSAKIDFRTVTGAPTSTAEVSESTTRLTVPIILSAAAGRPITVNLASVAGGTALLGTDFTIPTTSVTFAPGETSKSLLLNITNDRLNEALETIRLALTSSIATIGTGSTATVNIIDNDAAPTVSFETSASSGSEGIANPQTVRVKLSAVSGQRVTVRYAFNATGSTVTRGDYTLPSGTLTFEPGETVKVIPLVILQDTLVEPTELIQITLSSPTNAALGSTLTHAFSILDDDRLS